MTVYLLLDNFEDGWPIAGIFATREAAERGLEREAANWVAERTQLGYNELDLLSKIPRKYTIEEYEVEE